MKLNQDFAAVHAYLCADGYVSRNPPTQKHKYYRVGLRNTDRTLLLDFQHKFKKVFGAKPNISKDWDRCAIGSKDIYFKLISNYGSFKSREWNILKNMNKKVSALWLRAFFDCESWVWARKAKNRAIGVDCVNYKGLLQVASILKKHFNIKTSIKKRSNRDTYNLCIYGKEQLISFEKEIGYLHPFKKKRLREAIETYVNYNWDFSKGIKNIIRQKARAKPLFTVRIMSIMKQNLNTIQKELSTAKIESKLRSDKNGQGRKYYVLAVHGKANINKLISLNLLSKEQIKKIKK